MSPARSMPTPAQFREALDTVTARRDAAAKALLKADREARFVLGIIGAEAGPAPFTDAELAELGAVRTDALAPLVERLLAEVSALKAMPAPAPVAAPVAVPQPKRRAAVLRVRRYRERPPASPEPVAAPSPVAEAPIRQAEPEAPAASGMTPGTDALPGPVPEDTPPEVRVPETLTVERTAPAARKPVGQAAATGPASPMEEHYKAVYELVRSNLLMARTPLSPEQLGEDPQIQREIAKFHPHAKTRTSVLVFAVKRGQEAGVIELRGNKVYVVEGCAR